MRKIVLNIALSLDGYIAGPQGEFDWLFTDQDYGLKEFFSRVDTALIGRKTYDLMMKLGGTAYPGMKNYVFSHKRTQTKKKDIVFVSEDIADFVKRLKSEKGKDIWLVGGGELAHSFFKRDLVDEMVLSLHPIMLAKGISLFRESDSRHSLRLLKCQAYSTGLVQLHYARVKPRKPGPKA
jgi:dihydrofolate reductase